MTQPILIRLPQLKSPAPARLFFRLALFFLLLPAFPAFAQISKADALTDKGLEAVDAEAYKPRPIDTLQNLTVIGFGSCNKLEKPQTMFGDVALNNPNLWIWLGDIIYADTNNMKVLAAEYRQLKTSPEYKKLRAKAQIVGIYDDHDFAKNDSGKGYPYKVESKKCLLDFLDVPRNSAVRKREGAYQSYTFGKGDQRIKVIVLDLRYFRDTLLADPSKKKRYQPNFEGDLLGEAQWRWLENELRCSPANLNILCSSIQVLADDHGYEKWGNFPNARKRLLTMLARVKPHNLLIISGDRHMSEMSKMPLQGLPYPLYDFTSSGMTHIRSGTEEINRFREGPMIVKKNFGLLKVRWDGAHPIVTMEARGPQNILYHEWTVRY